MSISLLSDYLDTYNGRDKMLRTLSYAAKLATVATSSKETEIKLKGISSQMSKCRVILRLLDDIPMLHYALTYGWGDKEPDWLLRWVELVDIAVGIIYNPIEHICWAAEHKVVSINVDRWDNATTWFWIISLNLSLIKILRKYSHLQKHRASVSKRTNSNDLALKAINSQGRSELLTCARLLLDICYAVSYLPPGTLWGGRFKPWHVGALGTISSLIGLYQSLTKLSLQKKCS